MKILVAGPGRWGTFIAGYLTKIGHEVSLYGRQNSANFSELKKNRANRLMSLPENLKLTSDINECKYADTIVISVASQALRDFCKELSSVLVKDKNIVLCMKGLELASGKRLSQVASEILDPTNKLAVWLGPGHVEEFSKGIPNCMVIDSNDHLTKNLLVKEFASDMIRFYIGTDLIGNEIGAAAKNVIGIAAGLLDGYSLTCLKGALTARGTREIARLIEALGGNPISAYGLCHLGDYEATVFSPYSRNRKFGEAFAAGQSCEGLAEGYYTVDALMSLSKSFNVELPICETVFNIIYKHENAKEQLDKLFLRSIKAEF